MKIRIGRDGFKGPSLEEDVESLLVQDDYGNPIIVIQKIAPGQIVTVKANEPGFAEVLKDFGIGLQAQVKVIRR